MYVDTFSLYIPPKATHKHMPQLTSGEEGRGGGGEKSSTNVHLDLRVHPRGEQEMSRMREQANTGHFVVTSPVMTIHKLLIWTGHMGTHQV